MAHMLCPPPGMTSALGAQLAPAAGAAALAPCAAVRTRWPLCTAHAPCRPPPSSGLTGSAWHLAPAGAEPGRTCATPPSADASLAPPPPGQEGPAASAAERAGQAPGVEPEGASAGRGRGGGSTAVVIVDHGSRRAESNANLDVFVSVFRDETGFSIVEPAHMELARPSIADAFAKCVEQGASLIVVSPFFVSPGRHWVQDIPLLCAEAASQFDNLEYTVTAPIGPHRLVAQVLAERIQHCLAVNEGNAAECPACKGQAVPICRMKP